MVQHFISRLERRVPSDVKIVCQDEYLSSEEAIQRMVERGIDVQKHPVDAVAALVILEDYLKENKVETNL
jgi:RNase H-fold protein (predicted Holliday junction resolvase)